MQTNNEGLSEIQVYIPGMDVVRPYSEALKYRQQWQNRLEALAELLPYNRLEYSALDHLIKSLDRMIAWAEVESWR